MVSSQIAQVLARLPEVETVRLPVGMLFWADGHIYQVVDTGAGGYHKARRWRQPETTEVALVPGSLLARHLPLVVRGRPLPLIRSRQELADGDRPACFVFPTETFALDAAYLDVTLVSGQGAYVRAHGRAPAFAATDGVRIYRLYYYRVTIHGRRTDLGDLSVRPLPFTPRPHTAGPDYWRLLPSWSDVAVSPDVTRQLRPIVPSGAGEQDASSDPLAQPPPLPR